MQSVMVKPSKAKKNLVQHNASGAAAGVAGPYGAIDQKLYVGNHHFNMTESQLKWHEMVVYLSSPTACPKPVSVFSASTLSITLSRTIKRRNLHLHRLRDALSRSHRLLRRLPLVSNDLPFRLWSFISGGPLSQTLCLVSPNNSLTHPQ
ncbi:hypothetical protein RJT34_03702 [Clitoria ternatea]|uniref:Uncharacterized protein n=1 Tax=Clitoria ternatea TaxID=43366 RepID=A0AAN9Q5C2_CLITE